jgi:hypothetical protein
MARISSWLTKQSAFFCTRRHTRGFTVSAKLTVDSLTDAHKVDGRGQSTAVDGSRRRHDGTTKLQSTMMTLELLEHDKRRFVRHVLQSNYSNWAATTTCFTGCEQMKLSIHSMMKMTLSDFHFHNTLDRGTICLKNKERNVPTSVVGCWRHKHLEQCFTSLAAMSFFIYHRSNPDLHLQRDDYSELASWWNIHLIRGWPAMNAAVEAYGVVFDALGIDPARCPHAQRERPLIEFAPAQGELTATGVGPMTNRPVLESMAGFPMMNGEYFVARTRIDVEAWFPGGLDEIVLLLFPQYLDWCEQQEDDIAGDDSLCAESFLHEVIPFFAKVIVQDGCFWIDRYPDHVVSRTLRSVLPADFAIQAAAARQWCRMQEREHELNV